MSTDAQIHKKHKQTAHAADLFPTDAYSKKILQERAESLAQIQIKKIKTENFIAYVRFKIGDKGYFGIPYHAIQEIITKPMITKIPFQPDFVAGVINRRGLLLTVLNLSHFFNIKVSSTNNDAQLIIVQSKEITLAISVDELLGSESFSSAQLEAPLILEGAIKSEFIIGIHQTTAILNIETVLKAIRLQLTNKNEV